MSNLLGNQQLNTYEVQIGGCSLKLKSSHSSATVDRIVEVAKKQFHSSKQKNPSLPLQKTLTLSCLNMAEELVCLKKNLSQKLDKLESSAQMIASELKSSSL